MQKAISGLEHVTKLSELKRAELLNDLATAAALHRAMIDLQGKPSQKKGRKASLDMKTLLVDCARAWAKVTGKKPALWQNDNHSTEAVSVQLARTLRETIIGQPLSKSMKRQIADASRI